MNLVTLHDPPKRWFAMRVKSRCEKLVTLGAQNRGFDAFLPLYRSCRRWSDRRRETEFPLFTGYVFCRLDPQQRLPLLSIPGVLHFVGIGKTPTPIEDAEIAVIQAAVQCGLSAEPWAFLEVGQRVRLEEGPLAGLEGILVETAEQHRIVVSVTLLQRSLAVSIKRNWVRPLDIAGRELPMQFRSLLVPGSPTVATS